MNIKEISEEDAKKLLLEIKNNAEQFEQSCDLVMYLYELFSIK
jgi:hypothetical protein